MNQDSNSFKATISRADNRVVVILDSWSFAASAIDCDSVGALGGKGGGSGTVDGLGQEGGESFILRTTLCNDTNDGPHRWLREW